MTRCRGGDGSWQRVFLFGISPMETLGKQDSLQRELENTCTKVQVFHSQYREKEAKTVAKVEFQLTYLFCASYGLQARN
jgi:hypothetical protein